MHEGLSPGYNNRSSGDHSPSKARDLGGQDNSMHTGVSPGYANRGAASGHASPVQRGSRALPPAIPPGPVSSQEVDNWPPDALAGLVAEAGSQKSSSPSKRPRPQSLMEPNPFGSPGEPSPFAAPSARGMSVRRHSNLNSYGAANQAGHPMMSPPGLPMGNGGLNLQPNWPAFGRSLSGPSSEYSGMFSPPSGGLGVFEMGAGVALGGGPPDVAERYSPKNGPGHIPIGIRPSIQAQSAMLRELYPNGPLAAGPAGPLPAP